MEIELIKEYSEKIDEDTILIIRNDAGKTLVLDCDDEIKIRGKDHVEIKTEMGDIIQHADTLVALQTAKKSDFVRHALDEMFDIVGTIEIRDD